MSAKVEEVRAIIKPASAMRAIIRKAIISAGEPDAAKVAEEVIDDLPAEMVHDVLVAGVTAIVKAEQRRMRSDVMSKATATAHRDEERIRRDGKAKRIGEARRDLQEAKQRFQAQQENEFFNVWVATSTGPKFLGECTVADLRFSRDQKREQSNAVLESAARDELLAAHLEKSKYTTLREMGYDDAIKALA